MEMSDEKQGSGKYIVMRGRERKVGVHLWDLNYYPKDKRERRPLASSWRLL